MARFTTIIFILVVVLIVVLAIFAESAKGQQRASKSKQRGAVVKKKRLTTTAIPPTEVVTEESITEASFTSDPITSEDEETTSIQALLLTSVLTTETPEQTSRRSAGRRFSPENDNTRRSAQFDRDGEEDKSVEVSRKRNKPKIFFTRFGEGKGTKPYGCEEECDPEECPVLDAKTCPTGLVTDRCGCCKVCGAGEGNRCWDTRLNLPYNSEIGMCGEGLVCKLRSDLEPSDVPEALCECKDNRIVCGSDNVTYSSACKLQEAAHSHKDLKIVTWKPCEAAPMISTPVENVTVVAGDEAALSCEVRGYPPPVVHWEFVQRKSGITETTVLPGDDSSLVIVVRGGPDKMMTTSWIQMVTVAKNREGAYVCVAKNSYGSVQSTAHVLVV